jgi:hypothetical protein
MILKRIKERLIREYRQLKQRLSDTYYVSIGENCLTDNILDRFNIKSFSTPYSHGRSNIDYAIHLESEKYQNLLNPEFLYYDYVGETKVVRNKHYSKSDKIYSSLHLNGFEFTHHDVINNKNQRESYERKILRMCTLDSRKKLKFIYHYRNNEDKDIELFISKANDFLNFYLERNIKSELIFFTQEIVSKKDERALIKVHDSEKIKGYVLRTLETWAGDDQDVFWARKDDDLLLKMIKEIK